MMQKPTVALFVGSDVVAHREMCAAVKALVENDYGVQLFYPDHLPSSNPNAQQQTFKDYAFVERLILKDVFEYLETNPSNGKSFPTPKQICQRYNLPAPRAVANINDPAFFEELASDPNLVGTLSLRCTQMFKPEITQALKANDRFLINVHSGPLPNYRGLYSTPRAMFDMISDPEGARARKAGNFGCTIHHVDAFEPVKGDQIGRYNGIDTGHIIALRTRPVDPNQTVYETNIQMSDMAAAALSEIIGGIARGESIDGYPQKETDSKYYSYAGPNTLKQWETAGLTLFDRDQVSEILTDMFSDYKTKNNVRAVINDSLERYFDGASDAQHSLVLDTPSNTNGRHSAKTSRAAAALRAAVDGRKHPDAKATGTGGKLPKGMIAQPS